MAPPAILRCFTAADVQAYLRIVTGASAANFLPTNILNTVVLSDQARDAVGGNHLVSQGSSAQRVRITEFGTEFPLWGLAAKQSPLRGAWVCPNVGAWSYNGSYAFLSVERLDAVGVGGYGMGCLKGPNKNQPPAHGGNGNTYGSDRGWGKSSNGGGLKGFGAYGTENIADQDARVFRPNTDFNTGTASLVGAGFRCEIFGYDLNYGGAGVAAGYLWTPTANQRVWEYFDPAGVPDDPIDDPEGSDPTGAVGNAGDTSSPDGHMAFGAVEYGTNALTSDPWTTYFDGVLACGYFFTGAAADNIHAHKTTIVTTVQAAIDAAVV